MLYLVPYTIESSLRFFLTPKFSSSECPNRSISKHIPPYSEPPSYILCTTIFLLLTFAPSPGSTRLSHQLISLPCLEPSAYFQDTQNKYLKQLLGVIWQCLEILLVVGSFYLFIFIFDTITDVPQFPPLCPFLPRPHYPCPCLCYSIVYVHLLCMYVLWLLSSPYFFQSPLTFHRIPQLVMVGD